MILTATIMFGASCVCILGLFLFKKIEEQKARVLFPKAHAAADRAAAACTRFLEQSERQLVQVPPVAVRAMRSVLAISAVSFGQIAERIARQSHRLADLVSHKHNFERRETRSDFLKQVTEHKNGNGAVQRKIETKV